MSELTGPAAEGQDHADIEQSEGQERLRVVEERREEIAEDAELQTALDEASTDAPSLPGQGSSREEEQAEPDRTTRSD